jgi:hypothetical protein
MRAFSPQGRAGTPGAPLASSLSRGLFDAGFPFLNFGLGRNSGTLGSLLIKCRHLHPPFSFDFHSAP